MWYLYCLFSLFTTSGSLQYIVNNYELSYHQISFLCYLIKNIFKVKAAGNIDNIKFMLFIQQIFLLKFTLSKHLFCMFRK
jgi:hypothetical protein